MKTPPAADFPTELIEEYAELLSWTGGEMTQWLPGAHPDHNRWSWRGDGHGEEKREGFRKQARALAFLMGRAWDQGFDAGEQDVWNHRERGSFDTPCIQNPYRAPTTPDPGGAPDREDGESLDQRQGDQPPADSALPGQASTIGPVCRCGRSGQPPEHIRTPRCSSPASDGIHYGAVARIIAESDDPGHALWMFVEQERQVAVSGGTR